MNSTDNRRSSSLPGAEEVGGENAAGLRPHELPPAGPVAQGVASMPARVRIDHTVLAAIW
jgi:hypothetical protein